MNNQQSQSTQMCAITISREYGSGGGEVARRLAAKLGWQLIDHEVVVRVAHALGVSEHEAEEQDEYAQSTLTRILTSISNVEPAMMVEVPDVFSTSEESYHEALVNVVCAAARSGHMVIVGRGSQEILADRKDVLHVRIVAPMDKRITYVMQRENIDRDSAKARIEQKDRHRERYLQTHYHKSSSDALLYDLVLNSGILSLDSIVDIICQTLAHKAICLDVPDNELGPATCFPQYPGVPQDFTPHLK
jgi:CMP/dCMP kinase